MIPPLGTAGNLAVFAAAAAVVWLAGTRMAVYADEIAERTGLGRAFVGAFLLAVVSSLPEIATAVTGAIQDNPRLVVNNLLGGVLVQSVMLAVADLTFGRGALTFFTPSPALLLQGTALVAFLGVALAGMAAGPVLAFGGVSVWTTLLLVGWITFAWALRRYEGRSAWAALRAPEEAPAPPRAPLPTSSCRLAVAAVGAAGLILAAGWTLASTADRIATQTGLGASFTGATLVALGTSLPELSTTLAAVRQRTYSMAVSNIFGSNLVNVMLLFLADVAWREGPILTSADPSSAFTASVGVLVTAIWLGGLVERSDRTVGRLGLDSVAVLLVYAGFLVVSWLIRQPG